MSNYEGDGVKYKDASQKSLGYKVIKGEKSTVLMLKKKILAGTK